jgi:hypothetical protein
MTVALTQPNTENPLPTIPVFRENGPTGRPKWSWRTVERVVRRHMKEPIKRRARSRRKAALSKRTRRITQAMKLSRDADAALSSDPNGVVRRLRNRVVGRLLGRIGFWRKLFR